MRRACARAAHLVCVRGGEQPGEQASGPAGGSGRGGLAGGSAGGLADEPATFICATPLVLCPALYLGPPCMLPSVYVQVRDDSKAKLAKIASGAGPFGTSDPSEPATCSCIARFCRSRFAAM